MLQPGLEVLLLETRGEALELEVMMVRCCQSYECDRTSSSPVEWCNKSLGLRWSQGEGCGLDLVSLSLQQAGRWEGVLLQGPHLNISHTCQHQPRVAERARLSVLLCEGGEPAQSCPHMADRPALLTCLSEGGHPQPAVQAFLGRDQERRPLQVNSQTSHNSSHHFLHFSQWGRM